MREADRVWSRSEPVGVNKCVCCVHAQWWGRGSGWCSNYYYVPSSLHFLLFWGDMRCGVGYIISLLSSINYLFAPPPPTFWTALPPNGTENGANSVLEGSQRSTLQWRPVIHKTRVYLPFHVDHFLLTLFAFF